MLAPITYVRKPFAVEAAQVTEENFLDVALWCGGEVREAGEKQYIKVPVKRPMNDRQTRANVGDWVLSSGDGFKVYSKSAFYGSFEKPTGAVLDRLIQDRKPRPFPNEPAEMQEEVIPASRDAEGNLIVDLRDAQPETKYQPL